MARCIDVSKFKMFILNFGVDIDKKKSFGVVNVFYIVEYKMVVIGMVCLRQNGTYPGF